MLSRVACKCKPEILEIKLYKKSSCNIKFVFDRPSGFGGEDG